MLTWFVNAVRGICVKRSMSVRKVFCVRGTSPGATKSMVERRRVHPWSLMSSRTRRDAVGSVQAPTRRNRSLRKHPKCFLGDPPNMLVEPTSMTSYKALNNSLLSTPVQGKCYGCGRVFTTPLFELKTSKHARTKPVCGDCFIRYCRDSLGMTDDQIRYVLDQMAKKILKHSPYFVKRKKKRNFKWWGGVRK